MLQFWNRNKTQTMKKLTLSIAVVSLLMGACQKDATLERLGQKALVGTTTTTSSQSQIEGEYIVQLESQFLAPHISSETNYTNKLVAAKAAIEGLLLPITGGVVEVDRVFVNVLNGFSVRLTPAQLTLLKALPVVKSVEENVVLQLIGNETKKASNDVQSSGFQQAQYGVLRTGRADGTGKRAFIIDSGIDLDHDDLNVNTDLGKDFVGGGGGLFGGGGGFFGGGGLFGPSEPQPEGDDDNGHGTHCAGIVAALDNNIGVVGVAPNAEVVAIKCFNFLGNGNGDDVIQGIDYVASVGAAGDAVNMSFGFGLGGAASVDAAVQNLGQQGFLIAIAAGNDGVDANNTSPARANGPNLYTVSAMDENDIYASFSNHGNPPVDFCAPGVDIYSTYTNNGYSTLSGTSMAAPHVAGLLLITNGNLNTDGYVVNDPDGNADPIAHL